MVLKTPKDSSPVGLNPMNAVTILERDICWLVDLQNKDPAIL